MWIELGVLNAGDQISYGKPDGTIKTGKVNSNDTMDVFHFTTQEFFLINCIEYYDISLTLYIDTSSFPSLLQISQIPDQWNIYL